MSEIETEVQPHKMYTVTEVADFLGFSTDTVRRLFVDEPGVLILKSQRGGCIYKTMRIPGYVVLRVRQRLSVAVNDV